jgi:hypothetical protein
MLDLLTSVEHRRPRTAQREAYNVLQPSDRLKQGGPDRTHSVGRMQRRRKQHRIQDAKEATRVLPSITHDKPMDHRRPQTRIQGTVDRDRTGNRDVLGTGRDRDRDSLTCHVCK